MNAYWYTQLAHVSFEILSRFLLNPTTNERWLGWPRLVNLLPRGQGLARAPAMAWPLPLLNPDLSSRPVENSNRFQAGAHALCRQPLAVRHAHTVPLINQNSLISREEFQLVSPPSPTPSSPTSKSCGCHSGFWIEWPSTAPWFSPASPPASSALRHSARIIDCTRVHTVFAPVHRGQLWCTDGFEEKARLHLTRL